MSLQRQYNRHGIGIVELKDLKAGRGIKRQKRYRSHESYRGSAPSDNRMVKFQGKWGIAPEIRYIPMRPKTISRYLPHNGGGQFKPRPKQVRVIRPISIMQLLDRQFMLAALRGFGRKRHGK